MCYNLPATAGQPLELEAMFDASMQIREKQTNFWEGMIVFCRNQNTVHPIGWLSQLAGKIPRSTGMAKSHAAADDVKNLRFSNTCLKRIRISKQRTRFWAHDHLFICVPPGRGQMRSKTKSFFHQFERSITLISCPHSLNFQTVAPSRCSY